MRSLSSLIKRVSLFLSWRAPCAVVAIVAVLYIQGCNGPPLKPWHTEALTEEFTTRRTGEVSTFEDYQQLEDRLFAQLDELVYAQTATGPDYALVRYSLGSAADPRDRQPDWNRSLELPVTTPRGGVLLLHGMSDSPYSLRALGETLNRRGYWVIALRLPGHGTAPSGLTSVQWQDMAAVVKLSAAHLLDKVGGRPVHIIGYSTGAPLALDFTLHALAGEAAPVPASLVLISPAIGIHPSAALAKWKQRMSALPGLGGLGWLNVVPEFDPYKYNSFATNAADQVHRLTRSVAARIANRGNTNPDEVLPPILMFKSTVDATVTNEAAVDRLLGRLVPHRHELILFDINRAAVKSTLLISDPGPWTARLMNDQTLPFTVTLVTNENPMSTTVAARTKPPYSLDVSMTEPLELSWPSGVISLSHVALPIPPDDPLYGQRQPDNDDILFLGQLAIQGERGLLKLPSDWLLRLRYNPFYAFLESRTLKWLEKASGGPSVSEN